MKDPTKLGDDTQGVEVMNVMPDGPAAKAGLQKGDIITAMDNKPVDDANTLIQMVARKAPNSVVNLQIMRNKVPSSVNVTLGERQPQEALTELPTSQNFDQNNDSANQNGASNEDDIPAELMELLKKHH
jgi:serine protease DegS